MKGEFEEDVINMYLDGVPVIEIAKRLHRSREVVYRKLRRYPHWQDIKREKNIKRNSRDEEIVKAYLAGKSTLQIAKDFEISRRTVYLVLEKSQVIEKDLEERNGEMMMCYLRGWKYKDIAKKFAVSVNSVNIILRKSFGDAWEGAKEMRREIKRR